MTELKFAALERQTWRDVLKTWLLRLSICLLFIFIGQSKFASRSEWVGIFAKIGLGQWFRYFTGVLQIGGGVLVLIPKTSPLGIAILACTMVGAMGAWIFFLGNPLLAFAPGALLLGLLAAGGEDLVSSGSRMKKALRGSPR